jgi:hypothetical protein
VSFIARGLTRFIPKGFQPLSKGADRLFIYVLGELRGALQFPYEIYCRIKVHTGLKQQDHFSSRKFSEKIADSR